VTIRKRDRQAEAAGREETERERLADELAKLRAEVRALRTERDDAKEASKLRRDIEDLKIGKARMEEDNARKIREVEHKTGLLRTRQEHEVASARRETELEVREQNLAADKQRFEAEMAFQREHMQREVDRFDGIAKALMERLPVIEVGLGGALSPAPKARTATGRRASGG
jgi:hypothetical protein